MTTFGEIGYINLGDCISCIDFSAGGDYFAAGCTDESMYLWKANFEPFDETAILKKQGHMMGVIDVKFNKQATKVAVSSLDSVIRVWDIATSDLAVEVECQPLQNWKLSFPDRNIITCGELGHVSMYDSVSSERTGQLKTTQFFATALCMSPDGTRLAVGNANGSLFIFNRQRDNKMLKYQLHHKQIRSLAFTEDSAKLVSASDDQIVRIFDIESEKPQAQLTGHKLGVTSVDTHPTDNKLIISSSFDKSIKLWDIRSKHMCGNIQYHNSAVWTAKFNTTGKYIASGGESGILVIHSIK